MLDEKPWLVSWRLLGSPQEIPFKMLVYIPEAAFDLTARSVFWTMIRTPFDVDLQFCISKWDDGTFSSWDDRWHRKLPEHRTRTRTLAEGTLEDARLGLLAHWISRVEAGITAHGYLKFLEERDGSKALASAATNSPEST